MKIVRHLLCKHNWVYEHSMYEPGGHYRDGVKTVWEKCSACGKIRKREYSVC